MNYESEKISLVDRLKLNNQAALSQMENEPYRPVVYALTENQLATLMALLEQAAEFQPELYEQISVLATQDQIEKRFREIQDIEADYMNRTVESVLATNQKYLRKSEELLQQMTERISQDGKSHDEYFSKISEMTDSKITVLDSVISGLRRRIMQILCGTALVSVLLSLVVCLLLRG